MLINQLQLARRRSLVRRRYSNFPGWNGVPNRLQDTAQAGTWKGLDSLVPIPL